ncbi:MAG: diacylglycerol/lipid kinase family protein [Bacteroidia bacterium]
MDKKKKAVFVINPISGGADKAPIVEQIKQELSADILPEFLFWDFPKQQEEIKKHIREKDFDIAVAVGGDGTINLVAQAVVNSPKALAILPVGSGNGLARHLKIPLKIKKAIEVLNAGKESMIDSCMVNDVFFFSTSGMGFDAYIGKLFAESKSRGFFTYIKLTLAQFIKYQPQHYTLLIGDRKIEREAFLITFANASQYGNNAYIAPQADIADGLMDVCILKPFRVWNTLSIGMKMFNKQLNHSSFMETFRAANVKVTRQSAGPVHYDGEPFELGENLHMKVLPASVKIIIP